MWKRYRINVNCCLNNNNIVHASRAKTTSQRQWRKVTTVNSMTGSTCDIQTDNDWLALNILHHTNLGQIFTPRMDCLNQQATCSRVSMNCTENTNKSTSTSSLFFTLYCCDYYLCQWHTVMFSFIWQFNKSIYKVTFCSNVVQMPFLMRSTIQQIQSLNHYHSTNNLTLV